MGLRGPPPTPNAILELRGSNRADRNGAEPQPGRKPPRVPTWLPKPARKMFREICVQLAEMKVLATCDRNLIARYVKLFLRYLQVEEFLTEKGQTYPVYGKRRKLPKGKTAEGPLLGWRTYPHVRIAKALIGQLLQMEDRMGLSPSARARLRGAAGIGNAASGVIDDDSPYFAAG